MAAIHVTIGAQSNDPSAHLAGMPPRRFFTDALLFVRVRLLVTEYYGFDAALNFWDVHNVEAAAMGQKVAYPPGKLLDTDRSAALISTPSNLDRITPPDPYKSGRLPWIQQDNYTERLRERLGDKLVTRDNWGDAKSRDPVFLQKLRCRPGAWSVPDPDLYAVGPGRVKAFADAHHASFQPKPRPSIPTRRCQLVMPIQPAAHCGRIKRRAIQRAEKRKL